MHLSCLKAKDTLSLPTNLWNLETLIVQGLGGRVSVPDTIWEMVKLRHLHIYDQAFFILNKEEGFPESSSKMDDLQTISLNFYWFYVAWIDKLKFPSNLKKLTLSNFRINLNEVSALSNLEVMPFPWLEHLVLKRCRYLKVIPSCFGYMPSLKSIEVKSCKESLSESAIVIKEMQVEEMAYSGFEVKSCKESLSESAIVIKEMQVEEMAYSGFEVFIQVDQTTLQHSVSNWLSDSKELYWLKQLRRQEKLV
ncbi:hypothetical protein HAX54_033304 [Datura stramonium]|uniref:Uncharacterized protein n=1 Tax=Datura stramonium TaxID=4076 RepID=A0ABS8SD64_DATST|nr:hypothetical protein [Datura stramonium]